MIPHIVYTLMPISEYISTGVTKSRYKDTDMLIL